MYLPGGVDVPHEPQQQLSEVHHLQPPSQAFEAAPRLLEGHPARFNYQRKYYGFFCITRLLLQDTSERWSQDMSR